MTSRTGGFYPHAAPVPFPAWTTAIAARSATRRPRASPRRPPAGGRRPARRWLWLSLALTAALVLVGLVRGGFFGSDVPNDQIDRESRQRLERVLRDSERVPVPPGRSGGRS